MEGMHSGGDHGVCNINKQVKIVLYFRMLSAFA